MFSDIEKGLEEILGKAGLGREKEVYEYWRNKRVLLKRPLLRALWKPEIDDDNPEVAFRARDKTKTKVRRTTRTNQSDSY